MRSARLDGSDENLFDDLELYSLLIEYKRENWSLLSSTSWTDYEYGFDWDVGLFFRESPDFGGLEPPIWMFQGGQSEVLTEELRWTWNGGGRWQAVVGLFYEDNSTGFDQMGSYEGEPGFGTLNLDRFDEDLERTSVFADLVYPLADQWEVTVGGRRYDFDMDSQSNFSGDISWVSGSESGDTWKVGINFRPE